MILMSNNWRSECFRGSVGNDHCLWNSIPGHHSIEKCNANGQLLLGFACAEHEFVLTNSLYRLATCALSKQYHILANILTRSKDRRDVHIIRFKPDVDCCWTDHHRLISRPDIKTRRPPKRVSANVPCWRFDCVTHRHPNTSENPLGDTWRTSQSRPPLRINGQSFIKPWLLSLAIR